MNINLFTQHDETTWGIPVKGEMMVIRQEFLDGAIKVY